MKPWTRRKFLQTSLAAGGVGLLARSRLPAAADDHANAARPPNLVFILTDDQRWGTLGLTGNALIKTPHLDRLAAEGTFFEQATVSSPICTPSRACYFLGQYERKHGINFNSGTSLSPAAWAQSYPMLLRRAGYFTGYVGKNHVPVGPEGYDSGLIEKSFDFWYAAHGPLTFYPKRRHPIFRHAKADTQVEILDEGALSFLQPGASFIAGAETFLAQRPADRPFCLSLAFNVPHNSGTSTMALKPTDPELYRTTYRDQLTTQSIPATYVAKADIRTPKLPADVHFPQYRQKSYDYVDAPAALRERQTREYETITGVDRAVGAIRAALERLGCADHTVIVFSTDHGIMHGEFGLGGKALNYEPCVRIPMLALDPRVPRAARGQRSAVLAQPIDIAPTLLDLAGVPVPAAMQGHSLRPAIEGRPFRGRTHAFSENLWSTYFGNPRCESARTAEWKYIRYFKNDRSLFPPPEGQGEGAGTNDQLAATYQRWLTSTIRGEQPAYEELFHLATDPDEITNLAADPRHGDVLRDMRTQCQRLVTEAKGDVEAPPATIRVRGIRSGNAISHKA